MSNNFINSYIESDGRLKYCFVVVVVNNIAYANPSIVFADSVRKTGSLCDLVVMIDDSINNETEDLLKYYYNKIIKVKRIEINFKSSTNPNVILTKIHAFGLIEYKKIFLIDVDTILFSNIDKILVDLDTKDKIYKLKKDNNGILVFEPSEQIYKKALGFVKKNKDKLKSTPKPLDYLLESLFDQIDFLDRKISILINKYLDTSDGIQYSVDKPFLMSSNLSIQERMRLDHFKVWFSYFINIINKYGQIKSYECVEGALQVSKYFLASLSRFVINFVKTNKDKKDIVIKNIYGCGECMGTNYYHLDISKEYVGENINYNSSTYDKKDFLKYLNKLKETNDKFTKYIEITDTKKIINNLKVDNPKLMMFFLNKYIKMFPNVFVSIQIENYDNKKISFEKVSELEIKNNLVYSFEIELNKNTLGNILFDIFARYTYIQRAKLFESISDKNLVKISIFETISPIDSFDTNVNSSTFVFYEMASKTRLSSVFFNENSLAHYDKNMFMNNIVGINKNTILTDRKTLIKLLYLQSLKKWLFSIYSSVELENILVTKYNKNNFSIIDNNSHPAEKIKNILLNKLNFIDLLFGKSSLYKNITKKDTSIIDKIYSIESYWELDGIKFLDF